MKKVLALILALAMVFSLAACGGAPAPEANDAANNDPAPEVNDAASNDPAPEVNDAASSEPIKIGFVNYDPTAEQFLILSEYFDHLSETFNVEIMSSEALSSAEDELDFIDACAAAGCKAVYGYYNVSNEQALLKCAEYGMYYFGQGANEHIVGNPDLMKNEYYLGSFYVGDADYEYGYACVEMLVEAGCKRIAGVSGGKNFGVQMFIDRWQGAMDAIADYQAKGVDVELVYEVSGFPGQDGTFEAGQTEVLGRDDVDGLYSALSALMWIKPMQDAGKFGKIKVAAAGETMSEGAVGMFRAGFYIGTATEIIDGFGMAIPLIVNAVNGTPIRNEDGTAPLIRTSWWKVTSAEDAAYYSTIQGGENGWVFSGEDMLHLLVSNNPDVTVADYEALYAAVSAEEIQARRAG